MTEIKELIINIIEDSLSKLNYIFEIEEIKNNLQDSSSLDFGDYSLACFFLKNKNFQNPNEIALRLGKEIEKGIKKDKELREKIEKVEIKNFYINFFINKKELALSLIKEIEKEKDNYGKTNFGKNNKTMVEFPSPNTNKPLHLGHLRNLSIGESISRILEFYNEKVIRVNLYNDRGIHICKSMLAYQKFKDELESNSENIKDKKDKEKRKSDHFIGDLYVLFSKKAKENPELEKQAQEMLVKWEQGDKEIRELWKKLNSMAITGIKETISLFGVKHDKEYFESNIYEKGKEIILEGLKNGIFKKENDNSIYIDLTNEGLGKKYLLRNDGTSIYITQDIYLSKLKFDEFKINKSIYVVANEQEYHFKVLFSILDKLKLLKKENLYHLSYGMVNLPEGRMKSREGTVVDADDLINETKELVKEELNKRYILDEKEVERRSLVIALSAIKYMLLKTNIKRDITFNPKESIAFEGDTGPYLLYSYARANSILKKIKKLPEFKIKELKDEEIKLLLKINEFKKVLDESYKTLNPSLIANYAYQLSKIFNEFYHACPVINSENEDFRLHLVLSFKQILKISLYLLNIEVLEEM
jgi:arginyl-tRNA synthetase